MFRKIVSQLSFSPAIVGQLGFYAKRLRKEQVTRRLGLVFVALALIVQSLVVFQPPESANASNPSDFIPGGLGVGQSADYGKFISAYDSNTWNIKDIMRSVGITRDEIVAAKYGTWRTPGAISWGREPRTGEVGSIRITNEGGTDIGAIHGRPMTYINGDTDINGFIGYSKHVGWFAIMNDCGNLVTKNIPPPVKPPVTPPTPEKPAKLELSKTGKNVSQGNVNATTVAAKENDRITFTITVKNTGGREGKASFLDHLGDVLEYSTLTDKGGGTFNTDKKTLSWPEIAIPAGGQESRTYAVTMLSSIPATPKGQSDPSSYDCVMENVFGNGLRIPVVCAPPKVVESIVTELPKTGPTENMIFAGVTLAVVAFFYLRSKQLNKEVRLIRRDLNSGTL